MLPSRNRPLALLLKIYRPAGNPVRLESRHFDAQILAEAPVALYQSGTASLAAALAACRQLGGTRDEVILPAYGCPDLVSAVVHAGARPVLVDLEEDSFRFSLEQLKGSIGPKTLAVVSVVFLGLRDRLPELRELCRASGARLILDSAQWFPCGTEPETWPGDCNIISFGRGKPVNLLHGGAVICRDPRLAKALPMPGPSSLDPKPVRSLRDKIRIYNRVIDPWIYGLVARLPGLHIGETRYKPLQQIEGMSRFHQSLIEANIEQYRNSPRHALEYRQRLASLPQTGWKDLTRDWDEEELPALLRYPILIEDSEQREAFLNACGNLGCSALYNRPLASVEGLEFLGEDPAGYPAARRFAERLVTLPTHSGVTASVQERIVSALERTLRGC